MQSRFPWRRAVGESAFILLGILGAFWVDAWWDGRQEAERRASLLAAVHAEAVQNREALAQEIDTARVRLAAIDEFFRLEPSAVPDEPLAGAGAGVDGSRAYRRSDNEPLVDFLISLMNPRIFDPVLGASQLLLETPLEEEDGIRARALLNRWLQVLADGAERRAAAMTYSEEVLRLMSPYAARYAADGRDNVPEMAARGGPGIVGELRADDAFVEALALRSHWQSVYLLRLEAGRPILDSLIVTLEGSQLSGPV